MSSIETVLDVGTEDLTAADHALLEALSELNSEDYDAPRTTSTQYGYVIWPGDEDSAEDEIADLQRRGASPALLRIVTYAHEKEVFMINIDRDSDGLPDDHGGFEFCECGRRMGECTASDDCDDHGDA